MHLFVLSHSFHIAPPLGLAEFSYIRRYTANSPTVAYNTARYCSFFGLINCLLALLLVCLLARFRLFSDPFTTALLSVEPARLTRGIPPHSACVFFLVPRRFLSPLRLPHPSLHPPSRFASLLPPLCPFHLSYLLSTIAILLLLLLLLPLLLALSSLDHSRRAILLRAASQATEAPPSSLSLQIPVVGLRLNNRKPTTTSPPLPRYPLIILPLENLLKIATPVVAIIFPEVPITEVACPPVPIPFLPVVLRLITTETVKFNPLPHLSPRNQTLTATTQVYPDDYLVTNTSLLHHPFRNSSNKLNLTI